MPTVSTTRRALALDGQIEVILAGAAANAARAATDELEQALAREGALAEPIERIRLLHDADAS
jgi:hypothetical protein